MAKVITKSGGVTTEHDIEFPPKGFICLVHQQGIRVDVPDFAEINPTNTIACVQQLRQDQWEFMSTGILFKTLWNLALESSQVQIPVNVNNLKEDDMGLQHIAGMIILGCEAFFEGKSIFLRNPETYCHPKVEQCLVSMFKAMMSLCGQKGIITDIDGERKDDGKNDEKEDFDYSVMKEAIQKVINNPPPQSTDEERMLITKKWLEAVAKNKGMDHNFAQVGTDTLTVAHCIRNVEEGTTVGKMLIKKYFQSYEKE